MGFEWGYEFGKVELDFIGMAAILKGFGELWLMVLVDGPKGERVNLKPR
jgi:hypothetical protein